VPYVPNPLQVVPTAYYCEMADAVPLFDAAVVLGAGWTLTRLGRDRLDRGAQLWHAKRAAKLIVMGGYCSGWNPHAQPSETPAVQPRRDYLLSLGVDVNDIIVSTAETRDTIGEAFVARRVSREHGFTRLALVTSDKHMARALFIFRHVFDSEAEVNPVEVACGNRLNEAEESAYFSATEAVFQRLPTPIPDPGSWNNWHDQHPELYEQFGRIRQHFAALDGGKNEAYNLNP
jgi:uncharacterized SAM-binding protein YcdF (DUF218 family)